ncbi:MAG: hypothetical protein R3242_09150 [Akkermansiaceae bacterium]|nr:hypothetical protein [Akkermansiaceae bacterium]
MASDTLFRHAAGASMGTDLKAATDWALKITSKDRRLGALSTIYSTYEARGEEELSSWMDGLESSAPEDLKALQERRMPFR